MIGPAPFVSCGPGPAKAASTISTSYAAKTQTRFLASTATGFGSTIGGISLGTLFGLITPIVISPSVKYRSPPPLRTVESQPHARDLIRSDQLVSGDQGVQDVVPLVIDVGIDVMRDLPGAMAQTDAAVERGGAQPRGRPSSPS